MLKLSEVVAFLAFSFSVYTHFKTRNLRHVEKQLNQLRLEKEKREADISRRADLGANFVKKGPTSYRLKVFNKGQETAYDVRIEFPDGNDCIVHHDLANKFPLEALERGQSVELMAAVHLGTKKKHKVRLTWKDADGSALRHKDLYPTL